ncbi:MAG: TetR family transcriptional regulator [Burkholderiaceae bacterium]|nr:TetR family transcriptional regulator [Burkholderiaceae bacterium]
MARRTKADAQVTRNSLLDAAEKLFQARGVSQTSLNDIALAAGTTRGAIYWHFKDKADLFHAMMERVTLPLEQTLAAPEDPQAGDPVAQLRAAHQETLRLIATDAQTQRVLAIAMHKMEYTDEFNGLQSHHLGVHRQCVQRNQEALARAFAARQQRPPVPLDSAALGLQVLLEGLVNQWLLDTAAFDLVATGTTLLQLYLGGLGLAAPASA